MLGRLFSFVIVGLVGLLLEDRFPDPLGLIVSVDHPFLEAERAPAAGGWPDAPK